MTAKESKAVACTCSYCGAPAKEVILGRGGDYGWGDDKSRTVRKYDPSALHAAEAELGELRRRVGELADLISVDGRSFEEIVDGLPTQLRQLLASDGWADGGAG